MSAAVPLVTSALAIITAISSSLAIYFHFAVGVPSLEDTERDLLIDLPELHRMNQYLLAKETIAILLSIVGIYLAWFR